MRPRMVVVAGPPGSGKSTVFPVAGFGVDHFNADDRAAELNRGSFRAISPAIRTLAWISTENHSPKRRALLAGSGFVVKRNDNPFPPRNRRRLIDDPTGQHSLSIVRCVLRQVKLL